VSARSPALRFAVVRRLLVITLSTVVLAQMLGAASAAAVTSTESGSPLTDQGSNYNYRSDITQVTPNVPGLSLQVLEFADRLLLTNHTGKTVMIYGYSGEPYARVLANGAAEVNLNSVAYYLNQNFYGQVTVPANASPSATPKWEVIARTGQFEWHDHRIHYMSPTVPPEVKNKDKQTLVFDWKVPIAVGVTKGSVEGKLLWVPESSKASVAVIVLGVVIVIAGLLFVVFVRKRRRGQPGAGAVGGGAGDAAQEAW
jgi:hypothetical protein